MTHLLVDSNWGDPSPAARNIGDYHGSTTHISGNSTFWWGYLIGKDFKIADKFEHNTQSPNSFTHLGLGTFNSTDYGNLQNHLIQRIKNLIAAPKILDSTPASGTHVASLSTVQVFYSKPVNNTQASNDGNYALNGGGLVDTDIDSVSYNALGNADNSALVTINGTVNDASPDITLTMTGIQDTDPTVQDLVTAGNANQLSFTADTTDPATSIDTNPSGITHTNASEVNVTIDFGEAMRPDPNDEQTWDLEEGDLVPVNCSIKNNSFSTLDNQVWTLTLEGMTNGPVSLTVPANCAQDLAGNDCEEAVLNFQWDNTRPNPDISITPAGATIGQDNFSIEVDFHEVVTGFTSDDLVVVNDGTTLTTAGGNIAAATTTDQQVYSIDVTGLSEGDVTVDLPQDRCQDQAGNLNEAATQVTFSYAIPDTTNPSLDNIVDVAGTNPTNAETVEFRLEFSEPLGASQFSTANIQFDNCTLENPPAPSWNAANTQFTLTVRPDGDGAFGLTVDDNSYTDAASNPGTGNSISIQSDRTAPTVSFSGYSSPFTTDSFGFSVDFTEEVASFDTSKLSTTTSGVTFSFTNPGTASTSYAVTASNVPVGDMDIVVAPAAGHDAAGNPSEGPASLSVTRSAPPAHKQVVVCMDLSGSMNTPVTVGTDTRPKISFVKDALDEMFALWDSWADPSDESGLVQYRSTAEAVPAGSGLQPFDATTLQGLVSGLNAGGNTAMGPGLKTTLNMLDYENPSDHERAILLFADGQDNVDPNVTITPGQYSILSAPGSDGNVTINTTDTHKIPIHSIGIGENGAWLDKLASLSLISGGVDRASVSEQIWPNMNDGLQDLINQVYSGNTPQLVTRVNHSLHHSQYSQEIPFILNRDSNKLVITVNWPGDVPLTLKLKKGNTEINDNIEIRELNRCTILTMDFPHFELYDLSQVVVKPKWWQIRRRVELKKKEREYSRLKDGFKPWGTSFQEAHGTWNHFGDWVNPQGTWSVEVLRKDGKSNAPFNVSVYTDEKSLKYKFQLKNRVVKAGDPIQLDLHVNDGALPVTNIIQAQADFSYPKEVFGNVHHQYLPQLDIIKQPQVTVSDKVQDLHRQMRKIPQAKALLERQVQKTIKMKPYAKGGVIHKWNYIGAMSDTTTPGIYQIRMDVVGEGPKTGMFQRCICSSVIVRPTISQKHSIVERRIDPKTKDLILHVVPKDSYGNYVGPGYADYVDTNLLKRRVLDVTDNLDGSYEVRIHRGLIKEQGIKDNQDLRIRMFHRPFEKVDLKEMK